MFPQILLGGRIEIADGICASPGQEHADGRVADLVICVLGGRREWELVGRLCAGGPTLVAVPGLTTADGLTALGLGAQGCLDVTVSRVALGAAIHGIFSGEIAFSRAAIGVWLRGQTPERCAPTDRLTPRQQEILALIAEGASDKDIARTLGISTWTAQKHASNILERLGAPNRAGAVGMMSRRFRSPAA